MFHQSTMTGQSLCGAPGGRIKFNFFNLTGGVILLLILPPNILYAVKDESMAHKQGTALIDRY